MHVTPAAISHQVKALEENHGVKLFRRVARGLELTGVAEACLVRLREGYDSLAGAVELIRSRTRVRTITVGAAPSFAGKWLVPRIQRFVTAFPDIDVRIAAGFIAASISGPTRTLAPARTSVNAAITASL